MSNLSEIPLYFDADLPKTVILVEDKFFMISFKVFDNKYLFYFLRLCGWLLLSLE